MVSKLRIIWKQTVADEDGLRAADGRGTLPPSRTVALIESVKQSGYFVLVAAVGAARNDSWTTTVPVSTSVSDVLPRCLRRRCCNVFFGEIWVFSTSACSLGVF